MIPSTIKPHENPTTICIILLQSGPLSCRDQQVVCGYRWRRCNIGCVDATFQANVLRREWIVLGMFFLCFGCMLVQISVNFLRICCSRQSIFWCCRSQCRTGSGHRNSSDDNAFADGIVDPAGAGARTPGAVILFLCKLSPIRYTIEALCLVELSVTKLALATMSESAIIGAM